MSEIIDGIYLNAYLTESQISLGSPTPNLSGVNKDREIVYITDWEANGQLGVDARPGDFTPAFEIEFEGTVYRRNILTWESLIAAGGPGLKYAEDGDTVGVVRSRDIDSSRGAQTGYTEGEFSYIWGDNTRGEGAFGNMVGGYNTHIKNVASNMSIAISNYGVIDQRNQSVLLGGGNNGLLKIDVNYIVKAITNTVAGYTATEHDLFCTLAGDILDINSTVISNLQNGDFVYSIDDGDYYILSGGFMVLSQVADFSNTDDMSYTSIIGGFQNIIYGDNTQGASILGGNANKISTGSIYSVILGGKFNIIESNDTGGLSAIIAGESNRIISSGKYQLIGGGLENTITSADAAILHGYNNQILVNTTTNQSASFATISGGIQNVIVGSPASVIGGGRNNTITSEDISGTNSSASFIGSGIGNIIENSGYPAFIGSGLNNGIAVDPLAKGVQVTTGSNTFEIPTRYTWPYDRDPEINDKVRFTQNGQQSAPYGGIDYGVYIDGIPASADKIYYIVSITTNDVNDTFDATTVNPITEQIFPGNIYNFNVGDKVFISGSTLPNFTPAYTTGYYTVDKLENVTNGITLIDTDGVTRVRFTTPGTDVSAVINNVESQSIQLSTTLGGPVGVLTIPNGYNNIHMAYVESSGIYDDTGLGSIIVGGSDNYTNGVYSTIVGGSDNAIQFISYGLIVGGRENKINFGDSSAHSTIITGYGNKIDSSPHATIVSGRDNSITNKGILYGTSSFAGLIIGGHDNRIGSAPYSHIGVAESSVIGITDLSDDIIDYTGLQNAPSSYSNIISGQSNRIFCSVYSFIGAGQSNNVWGVLSTGSFIGTGQVNRIVSASNGFIGTGYNNKIGGSRVDFSNCNLATSGGPLYNIQIPIGGISSGDEALITVGDYILMNLTSGVASPDFTSNGPFYYYVASVTDNVTNTDITIAIHGPESTIIPVDILDPGTDAIYTIAMNNSNSFIAIVNGDSNRAYSVGAFIGTGNQNTIGVNSSYSVIDSGLENTIQRAPESFIGTGYKNTIINTGVATILSGENNFIGNSENDGDSEGGHSTILNGDYNSIVGGKYQLIGGGLRNSITTTNAAISHGMDDIMASTDVNAPVGPYSSSFAHMTGIQNAQLFGKMSIFNEDFESLMPSLSLTLNVEP